MENNYTKNIGKWLPPPNPILEKWFVDAEKLIDGMDRYKIDVLSIIRDTEDTGSCDKQVLGGLSDRLDELTQTYARLSRRTDSPHRISRYKVNHLSFVMKTSLNVLAKYTASLLLETVDWKSNEYLETIFRLAVKYNAVSELDHLVVDPTINVFSNDCPLMLQGLRKISLTSILQVLAKDRSEDYCHELIDCLLSNYEPNNEEESKSPQSADVEISENSSIEIYRALTKHMTPPVIGRSKIRIETTNVESIKSLVESQTALVNGLLDIVKEVSVELLDPKCFKPKNGSVSVRKRARKEFADYYQRVAWAAVSNILDHVVLWWSPEALAVRHSKGAQHLKHWLHRFVQGTNVAPSVRPALQNLCDALGCHVTITVWDQLFRVAYVSSFECQSASSSTEGTDTGQTFVRVFQLLVALSNECEIGGEWVIGAPLVQLPLAEQIIVLHRLDHSIHTMRLWAVQESRVIAHTWDLANFFLLVKSDVVNSLEELSYLKLTDHTNSLTNDDAGVQVQVSGRMRGKIVSEVNANIELLKATPGECTKSLATVCRLVGLANLHMCFPRADYWRKRNADAAITPSPYVAVYLDKVLLPVLEVLDDHEISNMILKIMCEAWLDYIYTHRIKFSQLGALRLLTDFGSVSTWLAECAIISPNVRNHLLKNEVLRRCEGVGRLLLRHPGEAISMHGQPPRATDENASTGSLGLERMPAEMYVPNQEQWLELRAPKYSNLCCCNITE